MNRGVNGRNALHAYALRLHQGCIKLGERGRAASPRWPLLAINRPFRRNGPTIPGSVWELDAALSRHHTKSPQRGRDVKSPGQGDLRGSRSPPPWVNRQNRSPPSSGRRRRGKGVVAKPKNHYKRLRLSSLSRRSLGEGRSSPSADSKTEKKKIRVGSFLPIDRAGLIGVRPQTVSLLHAFECSFRHPGDAERPRKYPTAQE